MTIDSSPLDGEKQAEFSNALTNSRKNYYTTTIGTIGFVAILAYFDFANWGFVIGMVIAQAIYILYILGDFKYIYYCEIENNSLTFYLLNLKGKKAKISFDEKGIKKFSLSTNHKIIATPSTKNKHLIVSSDLVLHDIIPQIITLKNKTV
jgi:hypothetical protein